LNIAKPTIEKITFPKGDQEYIDAIIEGKPTPNVIKYWTNKGLNVEHKTKWYTSPTLHNRMRAIQQKYKIGVCHICQKLPSYKITYKLPDITLIEYFCDKHFDKIV
jgi:hypothetical protein